MVSTTGYIAEQHGQMIEKVQMVLVDLILFGMLSHVSDLNDEPPESQIQSILP